ncbi:Hypothetical protein PHPALM_12380 [Phytophthora palmivora]|uniref:Uncharacterized protein n=1 Tax=Phytophthora palmivora TaxID=4796 RepID=A0A2P4XZW2_9STRA|nr:Hypothetical protein PHPALM_12380 [Phytophthora palmivora]
MMTAETTATTGTAADTRTGTARTTATTLTSTALRAPSSFRVMDRELKPWDLYDVSGAESPEPLATIQDYFRRFRALRGKGIDGVAHDSLQRSWCAMTVQWNRMLQEGDNFVAWLASREEVVGEHSLRDLRTRVRTNAWNDDRIC